MRRGAVLQEADDNTLIERILAGEREDFRYLVRRYQSQIYAMTIRQIGDPDLAQDLTQEIFIHLFRKLETFRGDAAFTTWLHRLTVNHVLMHFRKRGVRLERTTEEGEVPEQVEAGSDRPQSMPVIDRIALDKAIGELPPGYRTVFVLHDVEGYEHEEIANLLGCSVGTSKSQLHKARMRLRELLTKKI